MVSPPVVRGFNCPTCGAAIVLRAAQHTRTVACSSCGTILNPRDPNLRVVQEAAARQSRTPAIPLGTRGTLDGTPYDVIGFQYRTITVEGETYGWDEYVLFNPYKGFRYLSEYRGHWNVIRPLKAAPGDDRPERVEVQGTAFRRFQGATATTRFVLGEFPWAVRVGDQVDAVDFVAPPRLLSRERDGNDVTWSIGDYTPGAAIWKAFSLPGDPPITIGVFANQPSPYAGQPARYWRTFALLAAVWFLAVLWRGASADRRVVFDEAFRFQKAGATASTAFVTREFDVPGHVANLEVQTTAGDLGNDWLSLAMALVNIDTGTAIDFGRELSYYEGVEGGERWTEGSRTDRVMLPAVAPGRYYLRIEPEGGERQVPITYEIRLRHDVPRLLYALIALGLLAVPPLFVSMRASGFERERWAEGGDAGDAKDDSETDESDDD